jgi:hypothetical protein
MSIRAVRETLRIELEKVTLTSRAKLAKPSSLAYQRSQVSEETGPAAHALRKCELYSLMRRCDRPCWAGGCHYGGPGLAHEELNGLVIGGVHP